MSFNPLDSQRGIKLTSPLGDDLICRSVVGKEQLGRMFEFRLDLLSPKLELEFDDIVGQSVTVTMEMPAARSERFFNGLVTEFRYLGTSGLFASYQATLKPWLWFLTRTSDCRIFQNKSVPEIILEVFRDNKMTDFEDKLNHGNYTEWVYCTQYRETDFNFVSRLMEQEGIYYYFKHVMGKHTLVLADGISHHEEFPGYSTVPYYPPDLSGAIRERDHFQSWEVVQSIVPSKYAIRDFDFEKPKVPLDAKLKTDRPHAYPLKDPEIYDYPGDFTETRDGEDFVKKKLQALQAQHERVYASGTARGMSAGYLFKLENYPREDQNDKQHLIISVSHDFKVDALETSGGTGGEDFYTCHVEAMASVEQYRSEEITPKSVVQGPQTAIVVGPSGDEIYCDNYGRVKVQFHWDRYGEKDANSSCWLRVSQLWAGKEWGGMHIPRIGQEVLVSFLEGDPDQPMITGRVYNAENMPPYDLDANKTQSGIKSRSSKGGGTDNFNELRFEDLSGKEEVYFQAEKDLRSLVKHDEKRKVRNRRDTIIGKMPNRPTEDIETLVVHGKRLITIYGDDGLSVAEGPHGRKVHILHANYDLKVDLGKITMEAMQSIELKVGANSIKIDQVGITVKGLMITSEASAIHTIKGAMVMIN